MELRPADFAEFFRSVHGPGHDPFPWQQALVDRLAERDEWPDVLDLPTGAGKTAAMDAAVFHLALRADTPGRAALRIALVVDRRLVVDDAFGRAEKIAKALRRASCADVEVEGQEVVREVACRLRRLAGDGAPPLIVRRLRGGAPLEHDWARTPTQPTILCSTVDQIGSRLLFRGYGVSDRMKPVHAGLLGADSLILLDEAHLSEPFRQTLTAVRHIGRAGVRTALLSATPGVKVERRFELSAADRAHPVLKKRLEAHKPAELSVVRGKPAAIAEAFANAARTVADRLRERGVSPPAVGIVVNRVDLARGVFEALNGDDKHDATLMIGRSRSVGRNKLVKKLSPFRTGAKDRSQAEPLFIVATQCLEVGVDLDLDGLVTQAASLDALRQRFGRLNRAGRQVPAEGAVLARAEDIAKKADDPVYGDRIRLTWEALQGLAEGGLVDFGVEALPRRLEETGIDQNGLAAKRSDAPVVMPAYLDLWSQTSPRPAADPDVGLFLHGAERTAAGVSLVWRGDISEDDLTNARRADLDELLRLVPPRADEAVDVPLWAARAWLRRVQSDAASLDAMSDAPAREAEAPANPANQADGRLAFRWAGTDDPHTGVISTNELWPGDMLVVPAEYGGCDEFGWAPSSDNPVADVADEAAEPLWRRRCAVRIARDIVRTDAQWDRLSAVLADESIVGADLVKRLLDALPSAGATEASDERIDNPPPRDARKSLEALQRPRGQRIDPHFPYAGGREGGAVIVAGRGVDLVERGSGDAAHAPVAAAPATEDDNLSHTSTNPVSLEDHSHRVACFARHFARTLALAEYAEDLGLAAYLHDIGKADRRFQIMLSGGDPLEPSRRPAPGQERTVMVAERREARRAAEGLAARSLVRKDGACASPLCGCARSRTRPLADREPSRVGPAVLRLPRPRCPSRNRFHASTSPIGGSRRGRRGRNRWRSSFAAPDWPSLFEDLKRRYGTWGLAHLEAILRLADHRASEEERKP